MSQLIHLYDQIKSKALTRLQHDGLFNSSDVTDPSGKYFQDPTGFAMDRYAYYMCSKCQQVDKNIVILYLLFSFDIVIYNIFCLPIGVYRQNITNIMFCINLFFF